MDSNAAAKIESDLAVAADEDPRDVMIRDLRRERDVLKRENRILKISVTELERVSERDTLTPLYNRRYFITALHQRIARVQRYDECATVVYVDVNQLKSINDSYGHAAGDFALIEIAARLAASVRGTDVAARIGGDEFGLILDHMDAEAAACQIGRFEAVLCNTPAIFDGQEIAISACFGLATLAGEMTEADVMAAADADMYRAKRAGRAAVSHR